MRSHIDDKNFFAIKYENDKGDHRFMRTLKSRVDGYFAGNRISRYATGLILFKAILILGVFLTCYLLLISGRFSPAADLLLGVICGLCTVMIVMNIGHDAAHNALFRNKKLNKISCLAFELAGMSHYLWKLNHNIIHHPYPNVSPIDSEINQGMPFIRLSPFFPKNKIQRYQHFYAPFLYLLFTFNLTLVRDFQDMGILSKRNSQKVVRHFPLHRYLFLFASKLFYIGYAVVVPMLVLPVVWWKVLPGFFFVHAMMSIFELSIQFPLHANDRATVMEVEASGIIHKRWEEQVLENTTDYMPQSRIANFITGGINTHTVHHFFPGICHVHYIPLTKILADTAREFGLGYQCYPMVKGLVSHFRRIKQLAIAP